MSGLIRIRVFEFTHPLTIQQQQDKSLKQEANRIQIRQKQQRLRKQREKVAATTAQLTKLQNKGL